MGLDIYLYRYDNFNDTIDRETKYEEFSNKLWAEQTEDYDKLSQEVKDEIRQKCKEYAASLGLDEYGTDVNGKEMIEFDSALYPKHMFKIGYFRSSYNDGGIERILQNFGLPTLYDIFEVNDNEYQKKPDWKRALTNVTKVIEDFKAKGNYRVRPIYTNSFMDDIPKEPKEALEIFLKEKESYEARAMGSEGYNYSNGKGEFNFGEPEKILAFIPGKCRYIFNDRECVYAVVEGDNGWYINALEIVKETIEYVLGKDNIDQYYLHWSG